MRIHNGTYNCTEGLMSINKSLHLVGDNKSNTTIVSHSDKGIFVEGNNITIENISLVCKNSLQPVTMGVHAVSGEGLTIKHCNISGFTIGICVNDTRKLSILENYITSIRESNYYPRTQDYGTHKSIIAIMITKSNWNLYRNRDFIIENNTMSLGKSDDIRSYGIWIGGIQYAPANLTTKWLDNNETHNSISVNCCKIYRKSGEVCCCDEEYLCS